jgi:hypothetical protein
MSDNMTWIIAAWLAGTVVAYVVIRYLSRRYDDEWTRGARIMAIFCAMFWPGVVAALPVVILVAIMHRIDWDRPVKW